MLIGDPDHRDVEHSRMVEQYVLDLPWEDILATTDDHLFQHPSLEETILTSTPASGRPTVSERSSALSSKGRAMVIAEEVSVWP
jgi:hypothetical protein